MTSTRPGRSVKLVVGLGNPGKAYERNRHNVGFMVADAWARRHRIELSRRRPWAFLGDGEAVVDGRAFRAIVAKPRTFMNASGEAVSELVKRYQVEPDDLVVVYDDLDLPLGKLRLRARGSSGGHRGLASIIERLGTGEFARVRVGIGRPEAAGSEAIEYVLGDFAPTEREAVRGAIARCCEAIDTILAEGIDGAMNRWNAP